MNTQPRRYAVAGTGHRAQMYVDAILGEHADDAVAHVAQAAYARGVVEDWRVGY